MTKTTTDGVATATRALSKARQALTDAQAQAERADARVRLAQDEVSHAENRAGRAEDLVIAGDAEDSKIETTALANARASLDAAAQGQSRARFAVEDAHASVLRAERDTQIAAAADAIARSSDGVPDLEAAIVALGVAYKAVDRAQHTARHHLIALHPGSAAALPTLDMVTLVSVALMREGVHVHTYGGPAIVNPSFDLGAPLRASSAELARILGEMRGHEKAA